MSGYFHCCKRCLYVASEQQCREKITYHDHDDNYYIQFRCPSCSIDTCKCNHCYFSVYEFEESAKRQKKSHRGLMQQHVRQHINKDDERRGKKQRRDMERDGNQTTQNFLQDTAEQSYDNFDHDVEAYGLDDEQPLTDSDDEQPLTDSEEWKEENRLDDDAVVWASNMDGILPPNNACGNKVVNSHYCQDKEEDHNYDINERTFSTIYPQYLNEKNQPITNPAVKYMWQKYQEKKKSSSRNNAGGFQGLVSRSMACDQSHTGEVASEDEARLMFHYFNLVVDMPEAMQDKFLRFLKHYDDTKNCNSGIRVPNERLEFNRKIKDGAQSMYTNFPSPLVEQCFDHSIVNLKELLLLMAGHGVEYNFGLEGGTEERRHDGLNGTRAMADLIENVKEHMKANGVEQSDIKKTSIGYIILWSDAFLRCFIKQKDNSIWILTATVCPPESKKLSDMYTYVLAIGRSGQDHTPVINHFIKQLNDLKIGFEWYNGSSNKVERVAFDMIAWSADRPERQAILGNRKEGTFGRVMGYAANPCGESFASCPTCYHKLIISIFKVEFTHEKSACGVCDDFTFNENNSCEHNATTTKHYPKNHPKTAEPMPDGRSSGIESPKLRKLTTKFTQQAVRSTYYGVKDGEWSSDNCEAFLTLCNINSNIAQLVYTMAKEDAESDKNQPERVMHEVWKLIPSCYDKHKFPIVPMHCLMHGMGPDSMELVHNIFSDYNKLTDFIDYANTVLSDIATFSLDYCRVKILPKTAWVAENSLGFIRLMSYLYGTYLSNNSLDGATGSHHAKKTALHIKCFINAFQALVAILMGERSSSKAVIQTHIKLVMASSHYLQLHHNRRNTVSDDETFLGSLGIGVLKAMASELQLKLGNNSKRSTIINKIKSCTLDTIKSRLQSSPQDPAVAGQRTPKIVLLEKLLNEMERKGVVTDKMKEETEVCRQTKFVWQKGNWLTLLGGIADQIDYLGSIRLIYESRNEAQIGPTKRVMRAYRREMGYQTNRMIHLQKLLGLQVVEMTAFEEGEAESASRYTGIYFYNDRSEIVKRYEEGKPICGTRSKECKTMFNVYIRSGSRGAVSQVNLLMDPGSPTIVDTGLHFCKFASPSDGKDAGTTFSQDECALLMPLFRDNDDSSKGYFTVIYNDYDVLRLDLNDKKGYPKVCRSNYTEEYLESILCSENS